MTPARLEEVEKDMQLPAAIPHIELQKFASELLAEVKRLRTELNGIFIAEAKAGREHDSAAVRAAQALEGTPW